MTKKLSYQNIEKISKLSFAIAGGKDSNAKWLVNFRPKSYASFYMTFFKLYLVSFVIFLALDLIWLGVIAKSLYQKHIGFLMSEEIRWLPALLFYFLYIGGLVFFAIWPALSADNWLKALLYGGLFGLICYATYDLTNLATLKGWPVQIVVYDLFWGVFISGTTAFITFWIGSYWKSYFS